MPLEHALDTYRATFERKEGEWLGTWIVKNFFMRISVSLFSLADTLVNNLFHRVPSTRSWELWRSWIWSRIDRGERRETISRVTADLRSPAKVVVGYGRKRPSFLHLEVPRRGNLFFRGRCTRRIQNRSVWNSLDSQHGLMGV